LLKFLNAAV